jgi:hypothetical protein
MHFDRLLQIARYAVENDFVLRKHEDVVLPYDLRAHLAQWLGAARATGNGRSERSSTADGVSLQVVGRGGGQWRLLVRDRQLVGAALGVAGDEPAGCYLHADTFAALAERRTTVERSLATGRLVLFGGGRDAAHLTELVKQLLVGPGVDHG